MRDPISDVARLQHMRDAIIEIENYVQNLTLEDFEKDSMFRHACVKLLEIIGEAANHLSPLIKERYTDVAWKDIVRFRNILVHEYHAIDIRTVWEVMTHDIPVLKPQIITILQQLQ